MSQPDPIEILEAATSDDGHPPSPPDSKRRLRNYLVLALQVAVSLGLLWWVFSGLDIGSVLNALAGSDPLLLALAVMVLAVHILANAWRWQVVWPDPVRRPGIWQLTRLLLIGMFFNQLLPPPVGGDAVRMFGARRLGIGLSAAALSIMIERSWGLMAIVLMILPTLPWLAEAWLPLAFQGMAWPLTLGLPLVAGLGMIVLFALLRLLCRRLQRRWTRPLAQTLLDQWQRTCLAPAMAVKLLLLSLLGQIPPLLCIALIGMALPADPGGGSIGALTALLVAPLAMFATVFPLSFAGWGVREGLVVALLAAQGIDSHQSLALSLGFGFALLLVSLPGAVLWRQRHDDTDPPPAEATKTATAGQRV